MDLKSRLRAIVHPAGKPVRELTYEPDIGAYEFRPPVERVGEILGGRTARNAFGECLVIDRRYESDRWHGDVRIAECEIADIGSLEVLDPSLASRPPTGQHLSALAGRGPRTVFIDLETTGLSGGAGTVAFLVGCGYYDLGAFQVRQFLLTSYSAERALLTAVADFFDDAELIVSYNGKTFDVPVMETRWLFHRMEMPLDGVPHFDTLHAARRLWKTRSEYPSDGGCRLSTLERALFDVRRVGDVNGFEIPSRFFQFMRTGNPRPLEPVLEHNRLDLVSLAAVTARAARLVEDGLNGNVGNVDAAQALAVGRIYERAGLVERAEACYARAAAGDTGTAANAGNGAEVEVKGEALYRLGLGYRRARRFSDAADVWRSIVELTEPRAVRRKGACAALRQFAVEALAIHHEHRDRDYRTARELALFALEEEGRVTGNQRRADAYRHRLARLDRKLSNERQKAATKENAQLFPS